MQSILPQNNNYIRVALGGSSAAGKTTLVAVLTKGVQDDGNGSARNHILNYQHEMNKGQTQSIVFETIGFDLNGRQILSEHSIDNKAQYQCDVFSKSQKHAYLIDLCGDVKFFKHSISAITRCQFNLMIIVIAANEGITRITVECLLLCELFKIPFIIVLTKCDLLKNKDEKDKIIFKIHNQISNNFFYRKLVIPNDSQSCANEMFHKQQKCPDNYKGMICPLFEVNSLNRDGIDKLLNFFFYYHNTDHLNPQLKTVDSPFYMLVFYSCNVKDIGDIPFGLITSGSVKIDQIVQVGLDEQGGQQYCKVVSIENVRNKVSQAKAGELVCLILQPLTQQMIDLKKVMVVADPKLEIPAVKEFWANISVLPGPTTIEIGYKPILESLNISRTVVLKEIVGGQAALRSGDCALVRLSFLEEGSEAMYENQPLILRSNHSVIYGILVNVQEQLLPEEQSLII